VFSNQTAETKASANNPIQAQAGIFFPKRVIPAMSKLKAPKTSRRIKPMKAAF
jgi:hypothetical protein